MTDTPARQLREMVAAGAPVDALVDAAGRLLGDSEAVAEALADTAAVLVAALEDWDAFEAACAAAWGRFPRMQASGAHGAEPDPRALQLFATPTYLQNAGVYSMAELEAMETEGRAPAEWVVREALRLQALLAVLPALARAMERGELEAARYAEAVVSLARRFAAMRVA